MSHPSKKMRFRTKSLRTRSKLLRHLSKNVRHFYIEGGWGGWQSAIKQLAISSWEETDKISS